MEIIVFLVFGLVLLIAGADLLVRGSSTLARIAGISPLIIGLTIVAFGTSAPELAINIQSSLQNKPDIAIGNVVGSNIFNILFILGLSAMISGLVVNEQLIRLDIPVLILVTLVVWIMSMNGTIARLEGILLFAGITFYTLTLIRKSRVRKSENPASAPEKSGPAKNDNLKSILFSVLFILTGLGALILGSKWLVESSVQIAKHLGLSELIIGLTIIAAGTSLPEVATSVVAAFKGEKDIAVGNVIGSNLFNLMAVLGLTAIIAPDGIAVSRAALSFDFPFMLAVTIACLPIFFTGYMISRWEGWLFFGYYVAYTLFLVMDSMHHDLLPLYSGILFLFVTPIVIITLGVTVWRSVKSRIQNK